MRFDNSIGSFEEEDRLPLLESLSCGEYDAAGGRALDADRKVVGGTRDKGMFLPRWAANFGDAVSGR